MEKLSPINVTMLLMSYYIQKALIHKIGRFDQNHGTFRPRKKKVQGEMF